MRWAKLLNRARMERARFSRVERHNGAIQAEIPFFVPRRKELAQKRAAASSGVLRFARQKRKELSRFACGALANPRCAGGESIGARVREREKTTPYRIISNRPGRRLHTLGDPSDENPRRVFSEMRRRWNRDEWREWKNHIEFCDNRKFNTFQIRLRVNWSAAVWVFKLSRVYTQLKRLFPTRASSYRCLLSHTKTEKK